MQNAGRILVLDTLKEYEIPEGVRLEFRLAGPVVRACAWGIDAVLRALVYVFLAIGLSVLGGVGIALMLIGFFLIEWFYPVAFEIHTGATPGKKAMGLQVIQDNGTPVSPAASIIRNLLRAVDFMPMLYGFGLLSMLLDRDFRRLGDLAAGTLVVYAEQPVGGFTDRQQRTAKPPIELNRAEQTALLAFVERGSQLSAARRIELAELLWELTGKRGQAAVDELAAYANWITKGP
jgi:uncharacterized RDD family membrane protein YckC